MLAIVPICCTVHAEALPGLGAVEPAAWHEEHGWILVQHSDAGLWFYRQDLGWLWTSDADYPLHYSAKLGRWLRYEPTKARLQRWYDGEERRWRFAAGARASELERRLPWVIEVVRDRQVEMLDSSPADDLYPYKTNREGKWIWDEAEDWTSGYMPAQLLRMYDLTGEARFLQVSKQRLDAAEDQKTHPSHDMWFKTGLPFSLAYELTGDPHYRDVVLAAAETYAGLFNEKVGNINCWNFDWFARDNRFSVVIDNITDLRLFPYAAKLDGGDPDWMRMARKAALTHARDHIRPDGSSNHIVIYDKRDGEIITIHKGQGWKPESTWTRGQSWAILGYMQLYLDLGDEQFLELSEKVLDHYLSRVPATLIPPWDFDAPRDFHNLPLDSSTTAIVAQGLWYLKNHAKTAEERSRYHALWEAHLKAITEEPFLNIEGPEQGILQFSAHYVVQGPRSYDQATAWGDYYFVEAIYHWAKDLMSEDE